MTEDLEAIDVLSERFINDVKRADRYDSTDAIILIDNSPLISQGEKVLKMYEAEAIAAPNDFDVRAASAQHLYRMGFMYYDAVIPRHLQGDANAGTLGMRAVKHANKCCNYMVRSYELVPSSSAAFILADMFRMAGFYGSAIYWLTEAGKVSAAFDNSETATKAKASRLDLQADGKTSDPELSRRHPFPTATTPGLVTPNGIVPVNQVPIGQTPGSASFNSQPASGGCGGKVAMLIFALIAILSLLHR